MSRFVFDTNALVSALLRKQSVSRRAFDYAVDAGRLLVSAEIVAEWNDVFSRDNFAKYVTQDEQLTFLAAVLARAELVEVTEQIYTARDPKDDKFLTLGISGRATCIVSGDKDLLTLNPFRGIRILSPGDFLREVQSSD